MEQTTFDLLTGVGGAMGVLGAFLVLILTGKLIPKNQYDESLKHQSTLAALVSELTDAVRSQSDSNKNVNESLSTILKLLKALPKGELKEKGEDDEDI